MIQAQQRKSYLAPPAPKSLKPDALKETSTTPKALYSESPRSAHGHPMRAHATPTSGEIPLNIPSEGPQDIFHRANTTPNMGRSQAQFLSLEHLSLETKDAPHHNDGRRPARTFAGDPLSAVDPPTRPLFPRVPSSTARMGFNTATLPMGAASPPVNGPPTGPLPAPPTSAGEPWRSYPYKVRND
jgi:mitogen-activated protein kinase kinase